MAALAPKLLTKSEFARMAGVSAAAITKLTNNGKLNFAMVGRRINANHEEAIRYLEGKILQQLPPNSKKVEKPKAKVTVIEKKAVKKQAKKKVKKSEKPKDGRALGNHTRGYGVRAEAKKKAEPSHGNSELIKDLPEEIQKMAHLPLRDLVNIFGTDTCFLDWLKATKSIEDIHEKRLKNAAIENTLVSRELMKKGVIEPIEQAHVKLLTDGAKTIAKRVFSMIEAGRTVEECEVYVRDQVSGFIRPLKAKIRRTMKSAKNA
jgi:hypothetical protein